MATIVVWPTGKTSDEIIEKAGNETRQLRTYTRAPGTSAKLKSLQDLSIRVNPKVTEEVMHHTGLWVDGGFHLRLHMCKVIHLPLESSDPFHRTLNLVRPITDVPFQRKVPVGVPSKGGGSSSEDRLGVTMRGVVTTTLMVTWVATPYPVSHWGSWGWAYSVVVACYAASMRARPWVRGGPVKLWRASPIRSNYSVILSQEYSRRVRLGNRIALWPYNTDREWSGSSHKMCTWTKWSRLKIGTPPSM
jgi:hypothetical protein